MKRILLLTLAAPWPTKPLLGVFHAYQAAALRNLGVNMTLFSPSPRIPGGLAAVSRRLLAHSERPSEYRIHDVRVLAPGVAFAFPPAIRFRLASISPRTVDRWAKLGMKAALRAAIRRERPDALVAHGAVPWAGLLADAAREHGLPSAILEHSADDVMRLRAGTRLARHYRCAANSVDAVFAVGPQMVRHLQGEVGISSAQLLPNGTSPTPASVRKRPRPPGLGDHFVILAAANYYRRKGLEELVRAFSSAYELRPDAELRIVTAAPESLRELIAASPARDRIVLHPALGPGPLRQWMAWADLFALPSWSEAFGLVYAEALSAGTPIVLTEDSGFATALRQLGDRGTHAGWIVPPRDVDALTATLLAAISDRQGCRRRGELGRKLAEEEFSWDRNASRLVGAVLS